MLMSSKKVWRHIKIRLRQSMRIYQENNRATFHPDPIWKNGASSNRKKNKMSCCKGSVPAPEVYIWSINLLRKRR